MAQNPAVASRTEIRDGMRITWHQRIEVNDGLVLRADVFRPIVRRALPGDPDLRGLRQGPLLPGRLSASVGQDGRRPSGDTRRLDQQVSELGGHRSRALGAARLRRDPRRFARRRLVGGIHGLQFPPRDRGPYQCIEWAGTQPWSNGKVGMLGISYYASNQWRVAGQASAAPGGHHSVGGAERPLPRFRLPRRHSQSVPGALGEAPSRQHSVRPRRAARRKTRTRANPSPVPSRSPKRNSQVIASISTRSSRITRSTMNGIARRPPIFQGDRPASVLRQLGRPGHPSARQLQRLYRGCVEAEVAGSRTATRTGRFSRPATAWRCRSASSTTFSKASTMVGRKHRR